MTPHHAAGGGAGELEALRRESQALREQFVAVSELGMRLASALDTRTLLPAIVTEARKFTRSEAGSLYVREGEHLVFTVAQNERLEREDSDWTEGTRSFRLPLDTGSLAGLAAVEKRTLVIDDVGKHPSFSRAARDRFGYEVVSMLVVPMIVQQGEVIGVLQLMNARDGDGRIVPYPETAAWLCGVLASHAATALEIATLHSELADVFDSLVRYTAAAIDSRDACTAGHSSRVASYAKQLAQEMGGFSDAELRELRFAGIFHDVGKIGVRECVLTKRDKIEPEGMALIEQRFESAREAAVRAAVERDGSNASAAPDVARLDHALAALRRLTVPARMAPEDAAMLESLRGRTYTSWSGQDVHLLTAAEHEQLAVTRGNLTAAERAEIEAHAALGHQFLRQVPFPKELQKVPEIVWSHHEKMDGTGYPRGLAGESILVQARIIAVVDVFDALTAADRPYKKAMPPERALGIIERERDAGMWDPRVVAALRRLVERGRFVPRHAGDVPAAGEDIADDEVWRR